jgi:hypothetical protein
MASDTVMKAEGCRSAPENSVDLVAEPSWITKFDGPAVDTGGRLEEAGQTSRLRRPVRQQLHKNRAKALSEPTRPVKESRD